MKKLYSVASVSAVMILFLILVSSTASASITETRITNHGTAFLRPVIYDNKIVWPDSRNADVSGNSNIYMYDLSTHKETLITASGLYPDIYDSKIVWWNESHDFTTNNFTTNIYMYDLSTKQVTPITTSGKAIGSVIYSNTIAWEDSRDGNENIYMYDLSTKKETQITSSEKAYDPAIYGNKIVYEDSRNGNDSGDGGGNIYMYDISTKKETQITTNTNQSVFENCANIYGNYIAWVESGNGAANIHMYDLSTKKETQITTSGNAFFPEIYGNTVAWEDARNGNRDIYAYDLKTHQEIHTPNKSDQTDPAIYGNKIVWLDSRNGGSDVYMGTISFLPIAAFTASSTSGKHPLNVRFTDKSTNAYYWYWNFGDKSTSTLQSPVHKYTKAGKYTVSLKVRNAAGNNTKTMSITVK